MSTPNRQPKGVHPLTVHYDRMLQTARVAFLDNRCSIDHLIDAPHDSRMGITLRIRPDVYVQQKIAAFLSRLAELEPDQYYYPCADLHVTVLSLISCYAGFNLDKINVNTYVDLVAQSLDAIKPFSLTFRGVTASAAGVMVQGYPEDDQLNLMRDHLRQNFKASPVEQSIDSRYTLQTAHCTVMRLRHTLGNPEGLLRLLANVRHLDFGRCSVSAVELVYNDWYQRHQRVVVLKKFAL